MSRGPHEPDIFSTPLSFLSLSLTLTLCALWVCVRVRVCVLSSACVFEFGLWSLTSNTGIPSGFIDVDLIMPGAPVPFLPTACRDKVPHPSTSTTLYYNNMYKIPW